MIRKLIVFIACCVSMGCAHSPASVPAVAVTEPQAHYGEEQLQAVLWMQTAVEYRAIARETYAAAQRSLDAALSDPTWNAVSEAPASGDLRPAVILDLDETSIDNSVYQAQLLRDRQVHNEERFEAFIASGRVAAVPGALEFLKYAESRGVAIFYITNQNEKLERATRENLRKIGFPMAATEDNVLTVGERQEWTSDKAPRRAYVAQRYRVLLLLGDDFNDFVSATGKSLSERRALFDHYADYFGTKWFMIPNPAYGSWERALVGKEGKTPDQSFATKTRALRLTAAE